MTGRHGLEVPPTPEIRHAWGLGVPFLGRLFWVYSTSKLWCLPNVLAGMFALACIDFDFAELGS